MRREDHLWVDSSCLDILPQQQMAYLGSLSFLNEVTYRVNLGPNTEEARGFYKEDTVEA